MREIKFRAWDGKDMWTGFHILPGDIIAPPAYRKHPEVKLEFMQYTGLKDKNGVEIYEGDIVKIHSHIAETEGKGKINIVEWSELDACYTGIFPKISTWARHEVIGNIHENPELLEKHDV